MTQRSVGVESVHNMKRLVQLFSCITGLVALTGCQTNQKGADSWYAAQQDMVRPLVEITGATNPDGTYQEVNLRFGRMAIYAPQEAQQFVEDDRVVRGIDAASKGVVGVAAVVTAGSVLKSTPRVSETTTTTTTTNNGD